MRLSWNEIRTRAAKFADDWRDAAYEKGETQSFYNDFFGIFDVKRRSVARYEEQVRNKLGDWSGFIDLLWPSVLIVEQKSAGRDLAKAKGQARAYFDALQERDRPRFILVSDFQNFELEDLDEREETVFTLPNLPAHVEKFGFILGVQRRTFRDQDPVNIEAAELMGRLHDALEASGYRGHDLEMFLVRVVFCLFADDTGIFEPRDIFLELLEIRTREDGSDLGGWLARLFQVLNTPADQREAMIDEDLARFPYVNGDLFAAQLAIPDFNAAMRTALVDACRFDWTAISPAIFGALFQSVMEPAERRAQGAHYTTEKNILKVIEPLFLDDLRAEFNRLRARKDSHRRAELRAFQKRLGEMTFFDPACGCGNFLIIAYRELRELEIELIRELHRGRSGEVQQVLDTAVLSRVTVDQFYGIELGEFAARIAETALWMMDHIMNNRLSLAFGQSYVRIPLEGSPPIRNADAREVDLGRRSAAGRLFLRVRQPAVWRSDVPERKTARAGAPHRCFGQDRWNTRLCDGMVYQSRKVRPKEIGTDRFRCHQFDHPRRAGGTTLANPLSALRLGDRPRASHVRLGLGCTRQGPCACCHYRTRRQGSASGQRNACSAIPTPTANRKKPGTPLSRRICLTQVGSPIRI